MSKQSPSDPYKAQGPLPNESRHFVGVDLWTNPQDMDGGFLLQADNVTLRAGMLVIRPGKNGLYGGNAPSSSSSSSSSHSSVSSSSSAYYDVGNTYYTVPASDIYALSDFTDSSGNAWSIFTSGGKIYKTQQASASYTELLAVGGSHYSFDSADLDAGRLGDYVYMADGAHPLTRISLAGGYPAYAMHAPTKSPVAALTNGFLFQANNASNWSFDGQATPYANLFASIGLINAPGNTWASGNIGGASTGGDYINLIGAGAYLTLSGASAGDSNGGYVALAALSGNSALYPSRFHFLMSAIKDASAGNASVNVVVTPYDSSHVQLGAAIVQNVNPTLGLQQFDLIFDFSGLGPSVAYLRFTVINAAGSNGNMFIKTPSLYPISVQTSFVSGSAAVTVIPSISGGAISLPSSSSSSQSGNSSSSPTGGGVPHNSTDLLDVLDYQGTSFLFTFPSSSSSSSSSASGWSSSSGQAVGGIDMSTVDRLVIGLSGVASWSGVAWNLYLEKVGGTFLLAANGTFIAADQSGLDCDISTLTAAERQHIIGIKLTFLTNPVWTSPFYALQLGPITTPGNLSVGDANYQHWVTETALIDSSNAIESNPSLASNPLTPTFAQAEALVKLPTDCPANSPQTNRYNFYRMGGVWSDARLIATVSTTVSVVYGSDPANPYYSWNHVTGEFLDNTPDTFLAIATLMSFSRDPMPQNAQAIAVWQGRLCVAVGNTLYLSWLYNTDNSAALMTTLVLNLDDPNYPIAGASFPISPDPSDTIVRLIPFGTPVQAGNQFGGGLLVLCKRSVWMVQGTDSSNFSVRQYDYSEGVGLIARRGVARVSANEVVFMGPDRLHVFPPSGDSPLRDLGLRIQPQLYPVPPQTLQDATAMSKSWMWFHDSRLMVGCPAPGGTANSVVWLFDFRQQGWTRWTSMAATSALSLPPTVNGADYDLYLYGIGGQLYRMTGTVDKATPVATPADIGFTLVFHGMRPAFYTRYISRPLYYVWARLEWVEIEMNMTGTLTVKAEAFQAGLAAPSAIAGAKSIQTYVLAGGGRPFRMNMPSGLIEGQLIEVTLSGSVSDVAYCRGVSGFISGTSTEYA